MEGKAPRASCGGPLRSRAKSLRRTTVRDCPKAAGPRVKHRATASLGWLAVIRFWAVDKHSTTRSVIIYLASLNDDLKASFTDNH